MSRSLGCDLGLVRDGDDLHALSEGLHDVGHTIRYVAGDSGIDFVEYNGRQGRKSRDHGLDTEHEARNFSARSGLCHRTEGFVLVGREEEGHLVHTVRRGTGARGKLDLKTCVGDSQRTHPVCNFLLDTSGRLGAALRERRGASQHGLIGLVALACEGCQTFVERLDGRETGRKVGLKADERLDGIHTVFALQIVDDIQAIIDVRHAFGVEIDILLEVVNVCVQIFEINPGGTDPFGVIGSPRQVVLDPLHERERLIKTGQDPRVVVAQHARGTIEGFFDLFSMRERFQLLFELGLFTRLQARGRQFIDLEAEIVLVLIITLGGSL